MTNTAALSAAATTQPDRQPGQDQRVHERAQHPARRAGDCGGQHQQGAEGGRHQGTVRGRAPSGRGYSSALTACCGVVRRSMVRSPIGVRRGPLRRRLLEDVGDLAADQLVPLEQRVAQRRDQVLVGRRAARAPRPSARCSSSSTRRRPSESPSTRPTRLVSLNAAVLHRGVGDQRVGHAGGADHLGRDVGGVEQVAGRAGRDVAEEQLLGAPGRPSRSGSAPVSSLARAGVDVLAVAVREQAERRRGA